MGFFSRRTDEPDPLVAFREPALSGGEADITSLLQELDVPFQRKDEAWIVEVGGAWALSTWIPRDATYAVWLELDGQPGSGRDLVRAHTETGLSAFGATDGGMVQKVLLPAEQVDATGVRLALAALSKDFGGAGAPTAPDERHGVEAALAELGAELGEAEVRARGDLVEVRIGLGPADPDETWAAWMLENSAVWGSRFGLDEQGTLWSIAAVPAPVTAGGLAWALHGVRALAGHYRS